MTPDENGDKSVVEWLRTAAIPLRTVEPRQGYADLAPLRRIIGDARIVSLGEQTHGTREFRKLMHRVFEFCVAELGFTMLAVEAPFPDSLAVNAYVLDGTGTAADALTGMRYWIWDTEEVFDLVEWMRWWNLHHARKVKFYGFVTDYSAVAALGLIGFLARVAPDLAAECRGVLAPLTSDFSARSFGQLTEARRKGVFACIGRVRTAFAQERTRWVAAAGGLDWHLGRLQAKVLEQAARFEIDRNYTSHDRVMAENVCALLEAEGPSAKAVLLSHNAHASRATYDDGKSMGGCLDEMVGRAQRVIGTSFDRGSFLARAYPGGELTDHTVPAAPPASFDAVLAQAGLPLLALDLAGAPRDGPGAWLASETPMRSIGGIYGFPSDNKLGVVYAHTISPRERFDAVLFVAETSATRPNRSSLPAPDPAVLPGPSNLELSGDGIPTGWQALGVHRRYLEAIIPPDEPSPRGGRTVRLSRAAPWPWGDGQLIQKISAQAFQGQRLRFVAAFRTVTENIGAGALAFLRFLPKSDCNESDFYVRPLATVLSAIQPLQSSLWSTLTVEADVPGAADTFVVGLVLTGNGAAWFGDLELATIRPPG